MTAFVLPLIMKPVLKQAQTSTLRKRFTPEEDEALRSLVGSKHIKNWDQVAEYLPGRTARQCRDRYNSALNKEIVHRPWTPEEDEIIITKRQELGPKWVQISSFLKNRSGNDIKNRWHKYIKNDPKLKVDGDNDIIKESRREPKPKEPKPPGGDFTEDFTPQFNYDYENPFDLIYNEFPGSFEMPIQLVIDETDDFSFSFT